MRNNMTFVVQLHVSFIVFPRSAHNVEGFRLTLYPSRSFHDCSTDLQHYYCMAAVSCHRSPVTLVSDVPLRGWQWHHERTTQIFLVINFHSYKVCLRKELTLLWNFCGFLKLDSQCPDEAADRQRNHFWPTSVKSGQMVGGLQCRLCNADPL